MPKIGIHRCAPLGKLMGIVLLSVALLVGMIMTFGNDNTQQQVGKQLTEQVASTEEAKDKSAVEKIFHRFDTWKARIDKFMSHKQITPKEVDLDKDAQVAHANIAIASSNIVGKGPGNSEECNFIPQAYSDFIYAIIIEEMGVEGALFVAMLCLCMGLIGPRTLVLIHHR